MIVLGQLRQVVILALLVLLRKTLLEFGHQLYYIYEGNRTEQLAEHSTVGRAQAVTGIAK